MTNSVSHLQVYQLIKRNHGAFHQTVMTCQTWAFFIEVILNQIPNSYPYITTSTFDSYHDNMSMFCPQLVPQVDTILIKELLKDTNPQYKWRRRKITIHMFLNMSREFSEWFERYENDVNNILCPSQSPDLQILQNVLWELCPNFIEIFWNGVYSHLHLLKVTCFHTCQENLNNATKYHVGCLRI